jgi:UbiD family decarboxylase
VKDLRQWIETLEKEGPEELVRIKKVVDPGRFEASAIVEKLESAGRFPAVLFDAPKAFKSRDYGFRLLMNTFGTFSKMALALDLPGNTSRSRLIQEILKRQDQE